MYNKLPINVTERKVTEKKYLIGMAEDKHIYKTHTY
jgi:hypothetical protein